MNSSVNDGDPAQQATVGKSFRDVMDSQKLPALPIVAGKVLEMIQDPDLNVQKLCRVLSDDAALAGRVLAVSRSPVYAQRNAPNTLVGAVQMLGFRTLNTVVVANATHSLWLKGNKTSEMLWNHSLAVALAMRILCKRAGYRDRDQAFLAGLLHDVGEMILVHGDPQGFAKLGQEVQQSGAQMIDKEQEVYQFDHTLIGMTLLESWGIDAQIAQAVLNHHTDVGAEQANPLAAILAVADYVSFQAKLGFFATPPLPPANSLALCQLADDPTMAQAVEQVSRAYQEESALFRPS